MVIITTLYCLAVYLVFFKWKLLPWNKATQGVALVLGVVILSIFLVGLQGLTPASIQAFITGPVTEIAPQVSGRVIEVPAEANVELDPGEVIYQIDPRPYQYRVDQLKAQLADTESLVAQLKESYDAARAQTAATLEQLELTRLRLSEQQQLVAAGAGSRFELEQYESQEKQIASQLEAARANENAAYLNLSSSVGDQQSRVAQVLAQLESAQFDLENTSVRTPGCGVVTGLTLRPGMQVSPLRSVASFVHTDELRIVAVLEQKALQGVKVGDLAKINFPALPGRVFDGEVTTVPAAIGEGQFYVSGQLPRVSDQRMTRLFWILVSIPDEFPPELRKVGVAASVRIHTENAGVVGIVALVLQWVQTSLDAVM
jgi:multidrug resistance efflux pump